MQVIILPRNQDRTRLIERVAGCLRGLPTDKAFRLEVTEQKPLRSTQQNRALWGVIYPAILKAGGETLAGWTADDLHDYLLGECYGWETVKGFGRKRMRPLRRSSKLSKTEFMDYIAFIQQRLAEHGIFVPDPSAEFA